VDSRISKRPTKFSDPAKRNLYNQDLEQEEAEMHSRPEPIFSRPQSRPERLIPEPYG
jgi:hypothetical protein